MFVESYTLKDLTLCDDVIDFFDNATDLHYSGEVGEDIVDKTHKDCLQCNFCLLYTSPSPRDRQKSRMPSSA